MQVTYQGFTPSERTLAVDESDLAVLYDLLRRQFLKHVEFGFDQPTQSPPQGEWPSQPNDNHASDAARSLKEVDLQEEFAGWRNDLANPIDQRAR